MGIVKVPKNENFTVMSNYHLRDKELSLKAKGLLSWMLSLPDDWDYSVAGIVACVKESKDAVNGALKEMEKLGYLVRERNRGKNGKFEVDYCIIPKPERIIRSGKTVAENPPQINTNKQSTKKQKESKKVEIDGRNYESILNSKVDNSKVREALVGYLQMRIMHKKAPTNRALDILISTLYKLSNDPMEQVKILDKATVNCWMDLYSANKYTKKGNRSTSKKSWQLPKVPDVPQELATDDKGSLITF